MERITTPAHSKRSVDDAHTSGSKRRKIQHSNSHEAYSYATQSRSDGAERATNVALFTPNRKPKNSGHPSSQKKVAATCRLFKRYKTISDEAKHARTSRDSAEMIFENYKSGMACLKSREFSLTLEIQEAECEIKEALKRKQLLYDQKLDNDYEMKDHEVGLTAAEVDFNQWESIHAEKHQRSNLISFLMKRKQCVGFVGDHLEGCTKNDLRFLYEITSSNAVMQLKIANMNDIFKELCFGGYKGLKPEWNERMKWASEDWEGGLTEKRKWMWNMFLEIFGYNDISEV